MSKKFSINKYCYKQKYCLYGFFTPLNLLKLPKKLYI